MNKIPFIFDEEKWDSPTEATRYQQKSERNRIFAFLAGLKSDLEEVRGRLLGRHPLPSIRKVFSEVRREESRQ